MRVQKMRGERPIPNQKQLPQHMRKRVLMLKLREEMTARIRTSGQRLSEEKSEQARKEEKAVK